MSNDSNLARDIFNRAHLTGEFQLRSGVVAHLTVTTSLREGSERMFLSTLSA